MLTLSGLQKKKELDLDCMRVGLEPGRGQRPYDYTIIKYADGFLCP